MNLTENALKVLEARYLLRDEQGGITETPEQMFRRVAHAIASAEDLYGGDRQGWENVFYSLMADLRFLPNSPALMNAGKKAGQLAACFVLPIQDSMTSIFDTLKHAALILQSGGGTGFSFSHLRPRSDTVRSTGGIASGPVSFMRIYNTATEVVKQGGARRGANMGVLRVDHPDILEFIRIKRSEGELTNFNISIGFTDVFLKALSKDMEYDLVNPRTGAAAGRLNARVVFDEVVASAWSTGDPGVLFLDRINEQNPTPRIGRIESTNPCGEQPLLPYEACVLGSIDISKYVIQQGNDKGWERKDSLFERLALTRLSKDIGTAIRFLDNSIDVNRYPVAEIERMHKGNRKVGLGVMGWADTLIQLGIPYNHSRAFCLGRELMKFIRDTAREASSALAEERGLFPNFQGSLYDTPGMPRVRNATTTTIAPTGTLSIIAGCSGSIEPLFAIAYKRMILDTEFQEVNPHFFRIAKERGFYSSALRKRVMENGDTRGIREVPRDIKQLFRTAHEIPPKDHIEMQACFQEFTDNAVSKTINLPHSAKKSDVADAFLLAYEKKCKGITVFRSGTKKKGTMLRHIENE